MASLLGCVVGKNDFGSVFGFAKNCGFPFIFRFTKLTAVLVFQVRFFTFICQHHLPFMPLWYDTKNDELPC